MLLLLESKHLFLSISLTCFGSGSIQLSASSSTPFKLHNQTIFFLQQTHSKAQNFTLPHPSTLPPSSWQHQSDADFNNMLEHNSPHEASKSRSFVPHLESADSSASVISLQITLFPNRGFSIGISTHHAVLDGKSSTMFMKAWASICKTIDESESEPPSLMPELEPFFDREIIKDKDPNDIGISIANNWSEFLAKMFPSENSDGRCLKILPFQLKLKDSVRATFELTREDLEKIKKRVLSMWDRAVVEEESIIDSSKPETLSTFVLTCAYVLVCVAKAIQGVEKERNKFSLHSLWIAGRGSNRFGVYGIDFGWGRPSKVEITSVDRGLTIGLAESKCWKGGVEVGLVLNENVMDIFSTLFHGGLCDVMIGGSNIEHKNFV
ncbi:Transferase [Sesbania bispinosa]|nr:Transferase [Sesbania bispinosa]